MTPRAPQDGELRPMSRLWHRAWHDAHDAFVPPELSTQRSVPAFLARLEELGPDVQVIGPVGRPVGLCVVNGEELDQLYVASEVRGIRNLPSPNRSARQSAAQALLADGEARMQTAGVERAFLYCVPQNLRAAIFYSKMGWEEIGNELHPLKWKTGQVEIYLTRFEKTLSAG